MAQIEGRPVVARPVGEVFDHVVDPAHAHEWIEEVERAEARSELAAGAEMVPSAGFLGVKRQLA